jgi:hypothetical protein
MTIRGKVGVAEGRRTAGVRHRQSRCSWGSFGPPEGPHVEDQQRPFSPLASNLTVGSLPYTSVLISPF